MYLSETCHGVDVAGVIPVWPLVLVPARSARGIGLWVVRLQPLTAKSRKKKKRAEARFFFFLKAYSNQLLTLTRSSSTSVPDAAFKRSTFSA